jgi:hypothetical protein
VISSFGGPIWRTREAQRPVRSSDAKDELLYQHNDPSGRADLLLNTKLRTDLTCTSQYRYFHFGPARAVILANDEVAAIFVNRCGVNVKAVAAKLHFHEILGLPTKLHVVEFVPIVTLRHHFSRARACRGRI